MNISEIIQMTSLVLAPVVMISCSTIFLNGQLQRYDAISMRMRALTQERFDILRDVSNSVTGALKTIEGLSELRVREIEAQLPHLLKRHRMVHIAVLVISVAILLFVISICILALAAILGSIQIIILALLTFLIGMVALLSGIMTMLLELYQSNRAVHYEVLHALSMGTVRGLRQSLTGLFAKYPNIHVVVEDQLVEGDKIALRMTIQGLPRDPGRPEPTMMEFFRIENGHVVEVWGAGSGFVARP